jgi:hypothetical protein
VKKESSETEKKMKIHYHRELYPSTGALVLLFLQFYNIQKEKKEEQMKKEKKKKRRINETNRKQRVQNTRCP